MHWHSHTGTQLVLYVLQHQTSGSKQRCYVTRAERLRLTSSSVPHRMLPTIKNGTDEWKSELPTRGQMFSFILHQRAQNFPAARAPPWTGWYLTFVGTHCGKSFLSPTWRTEFLGGPYVLCGSDSVVGIATGRTMDLGLTQSLTQMSTRNISWG